MIKVIEEVKNIWTIIKYDIEVVEKRDPASRGKLEIVLGPLKFFLKTLKTLTVEYKFLRK